MSTIAYPETPLAMPLPIRSLGEAGLPLPPFIEGDDEELLPIAPGVRVDVAGGLEQLDTGHLGHPLVGKDQGDPIALQMELLEPVESLVATCEIDDVVVVAVLLPHVSRYRDSHRRFVVDYHQIRSFRHAPLRPLRATPLDYPSSRG